MAAFIFVLEFMSNFMRLISLSVRLFANILAGHLIILFMAGGLAVLLGIGRARLADAAARRRPLPLRGRPGGHAAGLHLRHPVCHLPRRRRRRAPLEGEQFVARHHPQLRLRRRRATAPTPARRSRSASAAASAPSAPASASASSSARSSSRSPASPRCATRSPRSSGSASPSPRRASSTASSRASSPSSSRPMLATFVNVFAQAERRRRGGERQLPRLARRRADDLDAGRLRHLAVRAGASSPSRASRRRSTSARRRSRSRSTSPSAPARRPTSCSPSTASGSPRRARRPTRSSPARARPASTTSPRRSPRPSASARR